MILNVDLDAAYLAAGKTKVELQDITIVAIKLQTNKSLNLALTGPIHIEC